MSAHRRPSLIPRSDRPRRIPAQQVRAASTLNADNAVTAPVDGDGGVSVSANMDQDDRLVDQNSVRAFDAEALPRGDDFANIDASEALLVQQTVDLVDVSEGDIERDDDDERDPQSTESTDLPEAINATHEIEPPEDDNFADYVRSVEEAAARSRAQQRRKRSPAVSASDTAILELTAVAAVVAEPLAMPPRTHRRGRSNGRRTVRPGGPRDPHGRALALREPDPRPRWKRPKTIFITFAVLVGMFTATVGAYAGYIFWVASDAYDDIHEVLATEPSIFVRNPEGTPIPLAPEEVQQQLPNWDNKDPFNILLLGIDERPGDDEPPRSDTMIVVRVYPETKQVTMMSIPRDLWVSIPGYDDDKINAAYPLAEVANPGSGPGLVIETISYNFDIHIHYYMTIDFDGFREVVNTLGGIFLDVRAPIKDDLYPTEDFGVTRAYFPTGLQKMDGETALRFARTRHGDNDIARGDRQQQVLMAIREQASVSDLITQAPDLIRDFKDTVRTDLDANQLLALMNLGRSVDPNEIVKLNLWDAGVLYEHTPEFEGDAFYMAADWPTVYELVATYFQSDTAGPTLPTPKPGDGTSGDDSGSTEDTFGPDLSIPVIVQNASGYEGVAGLATNVLENAGFSSVSREGTSDYSASTIIYDYVESPGTAQYIAAQFGLDESSIVYGNGGNGIVIVIGDDVGAGLGE